MSTRVGGVKWSELVVIVEMRVSWVRRREEKDGVGMGE